MRQAIVPDALEVHWDEVAAYLTRRLRDPVIAADLTQETYLRVAGLSENTTLLNPRAYLFTTARHVLVDHWRSARTRHEASANETVMARTPDPAPAIDTVLLSREELDILAQAVDALPPRTREVFRLHKFEQLSYAEIAQQLGMARNTVMVHMTRALARCRDRLADHRRSAEL